MDEKVWRTISGRLIFIKKGQSLTDAMKESGKFTGEYVNAEINNINRILNENNELENELEKIKDETFKNISDDELQAINNYTLDGYFDINKHLNGQIDMQHGDEIISNINSSIAKFKNDVEYTTYYGGSKEFYGDYKVGDTIDNNRFMSSSTRIDQAESFASEQKENGMLVKIKVGKNSNSIYLGGSSMHPNERETLFSNKQNFKVVGISEQDKVYGIGKYKVLEVETI